MSHFKISVISLHREITKIDAKYNSNIDRLRRYNVFFMDLIQREDKEMIDDLNACKEHLQELKDTLSKMILLYNL